jgi:benzylsuccinate CoA-transferase BbsE subunit
MTDLLHDSVRKASARECTPDSPLGHLRVIALPGLPTLFLGKWLADLGSDVLRLEPPGGDPDRCLGPFAANLIGQDESLIWKNYATGSRSISVDLTTTDGQQLARRLIATADVLLEAFPPGTLDALGLSFESHLIENPKLVEVSLSSFGQSGPWSDKLSSDLVNLALSGYMHMTGAPEGNPLKPSAPYQSFLHAANHGMLGLLIALRQVRRSGRGAHVDVSARDTGIWMLTHTYQHYDFAGVDLKRQGAARDMGTAARIRSIFSTTDGNVVWLFQTGPTNAPALQSLVRLMHDSEMAPDWLHEVDWAAVDLRTLDLETREKFDRVFRAFFATQSKASLFEWALRHRVMLAPVQTIADVMSDPQLQARSAWTTLPSRSRIADQPRVPESPVKMSDASWFPRSPAPAIGEHTVEICHGELGMTHAEIALAHSVGAI